MRNRPNHAANAQNLRKKLIYQQFELYNRAPKLYNNVGVFRRSMHLAVAAPQTLNVFFMKNNIKEQSDYDHFPFPSWECQLYVGILPLW